MRTLLSHAASVLLLVSAAAAQALTPSESAIVDSIQANGLRAHVAFLASDSLEGRGTPSKGLSIAAEYIAATYRRIGLKPVVGDSYYQPAEFLRLVKQPTEDFVFALDAGELGKWEATAKTSGIRHPAALNIPSIEVFKTSLTGPESPLPSQADVEGRAVLLDFGDAPAAAWQYARRSQILALKPVVVLESGRNIRTAPIWPKSGNPPSIVSNDPALKDFMQKLPAGEVAGTATVHIPAPEIETVTLNNVAGLLEGSDPALANTYLILSAHYDHVGVQPDAPGEDKIFNGANDDASGTAALLSIAESYSRAAERPKRSILFVAYFGEELGLLGSRYYGEHPLVPLTDTIASLNLEQLGRTDDSEGERVRQLTGTGLDYTSMGDVLRAAGESTGVTLWKHERNSDAYFARSDNASLAISGVPSITLGVSFEFPDYHKAGDHWDKIDYANFEAISRTVGLATWRIAESETAVSWVEESSHNKPYRDAFTRLRSAKSGGNSATLEAH